MALDGALTINSQQDYADRERLSGTLVGPSSYAGAPGEPVTPDFFPFRAGVVLEQADGQAQDPTGGRCYYDAASGTLRFLTAAGAEVLAAVDLSGETFQLEVVGR